MRLTNDRDELVLLRGNALLLGSMSIAHLTLNNGTTIEGALRRISSGSSAHEGRMYWYGGIEIQPLESDDPIDIDLLDIKHAVNVWDERKDAYEKAGLVVIVDFPYPASDAAKKHVD